VSLQKPKKEAVLSRGPWGEKEQEVDGVSVLNEPGRAGRQTRLRPSLWESLSVVCVFRETIKACRVRAKMHQILPYNLRTKTEIFRKIHKIPNQEAQPQ
jgi:hypothetical protein